MATCVNFSDVAVVDTNAAIARPAVLAATVGRLVTVLEH
uniref:Uncharacterized protein n=1 Tax=Arundo donax TaxID=35708 RepID=A0A0A9ALW3_ARUDO